MKLPKRLQGLNKYNWSILLMFLFIGWFFPIIGVVALICMIAPVVMSIIKGQRKWCAVFCPRGVFNDVILKRISRNKKIPRIFHSNIFKVSFLVFLIYNFYTGISNAQNILEIGIVFFKIINITTALTILLGIIFHPRSWCAFCPMGFLSNLSIFIKRAWKFNNLTT